MIKVLVNRKPVTGPWGGGNLFLKSLCNISSLSDYKIVHKIEKDIDIFFIINPRYDTLGVSINEAIEYKKKFPKTKIIQRINDCDARKSTEDVDKMLIECSKYLDATIFVSEWMKNYFLEKNWHCSNNFVLYNGIDICKEEVEKIDNEKLNIVTHHWSNNYLKGFDIYEKLDKELDNECNFTFTYIGRHRGTFCNTKIINPISGNTLLKELKKYDLYISASRFDPGPNHIIEAIACDLPILVHKDGGGSVEFGKLQNNDNVYENFEDLLLKIKNKKTFEKTKNIFFKWDECMLQLIRIMNLIINNNIKIPGQSFTHVR